MHKTQFGTKKKSLTMPSSKAFTNKNKFKILLAQIHLFKMCGCLDSSNRLHESVSNDELDVGSRIALGLGAQLAVVLFGQVTGSRTHVQFEHLKVKKSFLRSTCKKCDF
jgi:hypothetical protein